MLRGERELSQTTDRHMDTVKVNHCGYLRLCLPRWGQVSGQQQWKITICAFGRNGNSDFLLFQIYKPRERIIPKKEKGLKFVKYTNLVVCYTCSAHGASLRCCPDQPRCPSWDPSGDHRIPSSASEPHRGAGDPPGDPGVTGEAASGQRRPTPG